MTSDGAGGTGDDLPGDALLREDDEDLYENAPVAYFTSLPDGTLVRVNATLLKWTGYARDELVGRKRLHDLLPPGTRIYYETHYAPLLRMQGEVRAIAAELLRADGTRLPVLLNSTLVSDENGEPRAVRTTALDASERRRYEQELLSARSEAESRARAAVAIAHIVEGVVLIGEDGDVQLMNPAAERILGVESATAVGRPAIEVLPGWQEIMARTTLPRDGEAPAANVSLILRDEQELWLATTAAPAGVATVYTIRDVTGDRRLDQIRADIVTVVSHELRTPLTGTLGAAQTLQRRYESLSDSERRALLSMLVEQSQRLSQILDGILLASRIDNGDFEGDIQTFACAGVLDAVVSGLKDDDRSRIIVESVTDSFVRADLDGLRQVVASLVDNALRYSPGEVRLTVTDRDLTVRITISDDGPGIAPALRERVFTKFFRADPGQRDGVGGTGLGLYIARELTERMGGHIGFLRQERGTGFFVDLPRAKAVLAAASGSPSPARAGVEDKAEQRGDREPVVRGELDAVLAAECLEVVRRGERLEQPGGAGDGERLVPGAHGGEPSVQRSEVETPAVGDKDSSLE